MGTNGNAVATGPKTTLDNQIAGGGETGSGKVTQLLAPQTQRWGETKRKDQTNYRYKSLEYPISDLGPGSRHPYFMTFYILEQDLSNYKKPRTQGPAPQSTAAINAQQTRSLQKNIPGTNGAVGFGRKTHRSSTCIRLYMPETLSWQYTNDWRDVELSGQPFARLAQGLTAAPQLAQSMAKGYQDSGITGLLSSLTGSTARGAAGPVLEIGAEFIGVDSGLALSAIGIAVNPQVDVIYSSPHLRSFNFQFTFAPRSATEAAKVAEIVMEFKKAASPEMLGEGIGVGRYFVPPSEFDIEFSVETMGKISSCVLENINVDYAPSGTAFYKDDYPVYTQLVLQFKELEYMTKWHIEKGY